MIFVFAFLNVVAIAAFSFLLWQRSFGKYPRFFCIALAVKLCAGVGLGLVYTYYYKDNDTFVFFNDARSLTSLARSSFVDYLRFLSQGDDSFSVWSVLINTKPRSLFFVKFLSVINLMTGDNYWLSSLWLSFLSFLGCWYLFVKVFQWFDNALIPAAVSFLFLPSCLFWGSGIIKESIALGAACFIIGAGLWLMTRQRLSIIEWLLLPVMCLVVWNLKYYWAAICLPSLICTIIVVRIIVPVFPIIKLRWTLASWVLVFLLLCIGVMFLHPNFYPDRLLQVIKENHDLFVTSSRPEGVIHFYRLNATWGSMVINAPWALFSGLFRPFLFFESGNWLQTLAGLENLSLLILFIFNLRNISSAYASPHRLLFISAVAYLILLCIFLALSTPNFGTLSRYRIGFLPVFSFLVLYNNPLLKKWTIKSP